MSTNEPAQVRHPELELFYKNNPDFDAARFDFHNPEAMAELNWDGVQRDRAVPLLKSAQRLIRLIPDPAAASRLLADAVSGEPEAPLRSARLLAGADPDERGAGEADEAEAPPFPTSALQVAAYSPEHFADEYAPVLGEDGQALAKQIHDNANHIQARTMHQWANVAQLSSPHAQAMAVNHVSDAILGHYSGLPSYDQLFGSLNYCECDECKSIFGPAAYLVDLLRIIDQYATAPSSSGRLGS